MLATTRRELRRRVFKRCRQMNMEPSSPAASTCAGAACSHRLDGSCQQPDLLCCQWPSFQGKRMPIAEPVRITIHRSEHQDALMREWKSAMERSAAIQRANATAAAIAPPPRSKRLGDKARGLAQRAAVMESIQECTLPMDMECGCKTQREKEEREALALAAAAAKQRAQEEATARRRAEEAAQAAAARVKLQRVEIVNSAGPKVQVTNSKAPLEMQTSFHRRHLPQDCIAFSSTDGRKLFVEALNSSKNYMQIYFPLAEQFITQAEPAYCGLSTLAMCLNALQIDPGRLWKGPWRWFSEELFDCCTSLSVAKEKGISMSEFICLARCNGVMTQDVRADKDLSLDQFREIVKKSCSTNDEIIVLNYSRKVLGQTGDGHFSPIGGYHAERDMVLLLDVARFKYPPHWVKLSLVHAAMQRIDESSGQPRGLVVLKESAHATGPTLVKNMVLSADPSMPVKPAPSTCCSNSTAVESARYVKAASATC